MLSIVSYLTGLSVHDFTNIIYSVRSFVFQGNNTDYNNIPTKKVLAFKKFTCKLKNILAEIVSNLII